jgi:LuxR family maltose regulon positive regulatory protein
MRATQEQARSEARRHIIERPRLTRLLDETPARVIMLVAPAGYGKTTLARQWLANRPHAWLQATDSLSDAVALAIELAKVVAGMSGGTIDPLLERAQTIRDPRKELGSLVELQARELHSWPDDAWLVIDDYEHLARSDVAEEYVRLLVHTLGVRLVVTSRVNPIWVTARALLYGEIFRIGRTDLAMRPDETHEIMRSGSKDDASAIVSLADGWPVVIGLASLAHVGARFDETLPESIFDYLAQELFSRGSPTLQSALPQLALAPRITAELSSFLFGPRKGPRLLDEANELGFFSSTSPDPRFHPLLRAFLLTKGEEDRAAFEAKADNLIEFLISRCDWDDAFELIRKLPRPAALEQLCNVAYGPMLSQGRTATLVAWLDFAGQRGLRSPVFDLIRAELALRDGKIPHAERLALHVAEEDNATIYRSRAFTTAGRAAHLDNRDADALAFFRSAAESARSDLEHHEAAWGSLLSAQAFESEADLMKAFHTFLEREPRTPDDVIRASSARLFVALTIGGLGDAVEYAQDALSSLDRARDPVIRTSFLSSLSRSLSLQARYAEGRSFADRLMSDAQKAKLDFVLPHAFLARAIALIGVRRFSEATEMLKHARHCATEMGDNHNVLDAKNVSAKFAIANRDFGRALSLTAEVEPTAAVSSAMTAELLATRGLAYACDGNLGDARTDFSRSESLTTLPEIRSLVACGRAILRLHEGHSSNIALDELKPAFELSILDPVVLVSRASSELASALTTLPGLPSRVANELSASESAEMPAPVRDSLTPREDQVLHLISLGYTNREIASELFIAEVTAKVHVRNIIRKLGVRSRTEAAITVLRGAPPVD